MAKGSRGGRRGTGGPSYEGELVLPDGSKVEYDGTLRFGREDTGVKGKAREIITAWEAKRGKNKIEYAYATGNDGTPLMKERRGSHGQVKVPISVHDTEGAIFTHIHPRGPGMLGGTFSGTDMRNFAIFKNVTFRAKAKEGTYSITKGKSFKPKEFLQYMNKIDAEFMAGQRERNKKIKSDYKSDKIDYQTAVQRMAKSFNTGLVKLHDDFSKGQKEYGYKYTLEKA